jgi:hypothetical protein
MLEEQGGVCKICAGCNTGIGLFKDSTMLMEKAIKYLGREVKQN